MLVEHLPTAGRRYCPLLPLGIGARPIRITAAAGILLAGLGNISDGRTKRRFGGCEPSSPNFCGKIECNLLARLEARTGIEPVYTALQAAA